MLIFEDADRSNLADVDWDAFIEIDFSSALFDWDAFIEIDFSSALFDWSFFIDPDFALGDNRVVPLPGVLGVAGTTVDESGFVCG